MKIIVNSPDLNDAISKVSKALPARDVAPVLECIKVTAENDKLTFFATDKDLAIEKIVDANVIVGGAMLVPEECLAITSATLPAPTRKFRWKRKTTDLPFPLREANVTSPR